MNDLTLEPIEREMFDPEEVGNMETEDLIMMLYINKNLEFIDFLLFQYRYGQEGCILVTFFTIQWR